MQKILVIDDDLDICLLLKKFLSKKGFEVNTASIGEEGIKKLKEEKFNLVICDFKLPDYDGLEMLQKIKLIDSSLQVIIITGYSDIRVSVDAIRKGAFDYVTKPLYPDELFDTVQKALQKKSVSKGDSSGKPSKNNGFTYVKGISQQSIAVEKNVDLIAKTDMSVIILGETGTGKEYVARSIHDKSERSKQNFLAVDCGALPKDLAGSELFGHVKGSFTGALADKTGSFELADQGTLFLDEIGNLSYDNQVKLLRVLQEKRVKKIGGNNDIPIDVRIIVATNEDLKKEIEAGNFREDLYHRLNEFKIEITPLRERTEDILHFTDHFLKNSARELNKSVPKIDKEVNEIFSTYPWPGNLRELKNMVKRAVLLSADGMITSASLPPELSQSNMDETSDNIDFTRVMTIKEAIQKAEKNAILNALRHANNNKSKAAHLLGIDRKTLYNKLKSLNIQTSVNVREV